MLTSEKNGLSIKKVYQRHRRKFCVNEGALASLHRLWKGWEP
jgi:hypothetical protein